MRTADRDEEREYRIGMEIVVDAYCSEERAMGWYYYISDDCYFPFIAKCTVERRTSPLNINEEVEVIGVSPAEECEKEIFVDIKWNKRQLSIPLAQLKEINANEQTKIVLSDWSYWVNRGYEF